MEINEPIVREFYENMLKADVETIFLCGVQLDTSPHAFEILLQLPHIPPNRDVYPKIKADVIKGDISLDTILKKIVRPETCWEYSLGERVAPISIACSDLHADARIWQQIIADYLLPSTHATHIRVRVAVLLWAILEGKKISILLLIRESMWKRSGDQMSRVPNGQQCLPFEEWEDPTPKKRKTMEPSSSSAPPAPSAPAPATQPLYELVQDLIQEVPYNKRHNARRFQ
ncbi:hypothetical protein AHAS_Ahas20G0264100 [Arachis hypogaea]